MDVRKSKTNEQNERKESDVFVEYIFNGRCYYYLSLLLLSSSFFVHFFVVVFFTVSKSAILFIWRVEIVKSLNWDSPTILSFHIPSQHMPHSVGRLDLHSSFHRIYVNDSSKWLWRIVHLRNEQNYRCGNCRICTFGRASEAVELMMRQCIVLNAAKFNFSAYRVDGNLGSNASHFPFAVDKSVQTIHTRIK